MKKKKKEEKKQKEKKEKKEKKPTIFYQQPSRPSLPTPGAGASIIKEKEKNNKFKQPQVLYE